MSVYLIGYVIFMGAVFAALWKLGIIDRIGSFWTAIAVLAAIGIGIMMAVSGSGGKETIDVHRR
jgi:hypothetical protein